MAKLTKWDPFQEVAAWPRSLFGRDLFAGFRPDGGIAVEWSPRCDVTETDGVIVVEAELPGVDPKDIDVSVSGGLLTVRGEKRTEKTEQQQEGRTYSERFFGSFERSIGLPEGVDSTKIEAKMKDGVLEVRVPVPTVATATPNKIEIKVG